MKRAIITICLLIFLPGFCACGAELLVPSQYSTIRAAVDASKDGDTVIIAPGTYYGDGNNNISVLKQITIRSQDGPETCIINCRSMDLSMTNRNGFYMTSGTLAGLTITGGYWNFNPGGGAVICEGNVKITNCIFKNNYGATGGAISCRRFGNLEISNCSIIDNTAIPFDSNAGTIPGLGGGIYCENSALMIINSVISGNTAGNGGGICSRQNSYITIKDCLIKNNVGINPLNPAGGGGIYCERGSLTVIASDIRENHSNSGAGIGCDNVTSFFISDCNIIKNEVNDAYGYGSLSGGGIYYNNNTNSPIPSFAILNSSITDNFIAGKTSRKYGGGLYLSTPIVTQNLINNCKILRNSTIDSYSASGSGGGGLYCSGQFNIFETDISQNSATNGGGIYSTEISSKIKFSRCRLSGNSAMYGSAINSYAGENIFENCVISGNHGVKTGFAPTIQCYTPYKITNSTIVGNFQPVLPFEQTKPMSSITNSIIYWNQKPNPQFLNSITSYSDIERDYNNSPYLGTGNINSDPCFVNSGYWDTNGTPANPNDDFWIEGDYHLKAESPCIDSGGIAFLMDNKDLDGKPRIIGAAIDMGAYEYKPICRPNICITPEVLNAACQGLWISCKIILPKDFKARDIDTNTILLQGQIKPDWCMALGSCRTMFAKFDRSKLLSFIGDGEVELTVTGQFTDGTPFEGSDKIKVIGFKNP